MRAAALLVLAAGALGALGAFPASIAAHPGHGSPVISVGGLQYTPANVTVVVGDTVFWQWDGPDTDHSVTADPGQAEAFDSDPGKAPVAISHPLAYSFAYDFRKPGTFRYACKVHPTMTGTVTVKPAPPAPPSDNRAPRITRAALTPRAPCAKKGRGCAKPGAALRYTLDEDADAKATITRKGASKPARTAADIAFKGPNELELRLGGLSPGVYLLRFTATDDAGNKGTAKLAFRLA